MAGIGLILIVSGVPTLALTVLANNNQMAHIHRPEDKLGAVDKTPIQATVDLPEVNG